MPLYPLKCCELGNMPQLLPLPLSSTWTQIRVLQGVGNASNSHPFKPTFKDLTFNLTQSQLLKGLKCESKQKITEEGGVRACSLAHNALRGRGACWSSGMGLGRVDKLHSLTRAYTPPTQSGQCIIIAPLVLGQAIGNMDTLDSPQPELGGSHHLPPLQYTLWLATKPTSKWFFSPGTFE